MATTKKVYYDDPNAQAAKANSQTASTAAQNTTAQPTGASSLLSTDGTQSGSITGNSQLTEPAKSSIQPVAGSDTTTAPGLLELPGLSNGTRDTLYNLVSNGYQPSQTVVDAMNELDRIVNNQPAAFQSQYEAQRNQLMNQILGREDFSYDVASDPMYNLYREQYMQNGRQAMQDTMGTAAGLTGGYGNSYAVTAGNQAYQQYLTQLNNVVPELYNQARQTYNMQEEQLRNNLAMLNDAYNTEYGQYMDQYDRWAADRDYYSNRYDTEYARDYNQYGDQLNFWNDWATREAEMNTDAENRNREYAYNYALEMIKMGALPTPELRAQAGLSEDDVKRLRKYYRIDLGRDSSSSSSSSSSSKSSSSGNKTTNPGTDNPPPAADNSGSKGDSYISTKANSLFSQYKNGNLSSSLNSLSGCISAFGQADGTAIWNAFQKLKANYKPAKAPNMGGPKKEVR